MFLTSSSTMLMALVSIEAIQLAEMLGLCSRSVLVVSDAARPLTIDHATKVNMKKDKVFVISTLWGSIGDIYAGSAVASAPGRVVVSMYNNQVIEDY